MSATPVRGHPPDRLAARAVALSAVAVATFTAPVAALAIAYGSGREGAVEDNLLGALLGAVAFVGLLGSLGAFAMAIVARVRGERSPLLWLPLSVFPAIALFLVLGEALWWE